MLDSIRRDLEPLYHTLNTHPVYDRLTDIDAVGRFMELHVYSVWDFMNLLKYLQGNLTCTSIPWKPYHTPKLSRLINEIVLEEESDEIDGTTTSHFMYYVQAIQSVRGDIPHLSQFISDLSSGMAFDQLISQEYLPSAPRAFMASTYSFTQGSLLGVAAAFTFGRETLVPSLFDPIKTQLGKTGDQQLSKFIAYLERHIELDGEQHSKLAFEMVDILAKTADDWAIILESATQALHVRIKFWDGIEAYLLK